MGATKMQMGGERSQAKGLDPICKTIDCNSKGNFKKNSNFFENFQFTGK
jgi:hypothetical protein